MNRISIAVAMMVLVACGERSAPTTVSGAAASSSSSPNAASTTVRVDRQLLDSGRIVTSPVIERGASSERRWPGQVESTADGRATAGALVAGRIVAIEVDVGSSVKRGQVLAWLDAPEVARATAELLRARARADVGRRKLDRQLALQGQDATSKNAVDEARAEDATAGADLIAARTLLTNLGGVEPQVEAKRFNLRVAVRAPIDGIIVERDAVLGGPVTSDRSLFQIVATDHAFVRARVPEGDELPSVSTKVTILARGSISADAGATCTGTVSADLGTVDPATRTHALRIDVMGPCLLLTPGRYVDVVSTLASPEKTETAKTASLVVPHDAVVQVHDTAMVFVAKDDGTFAARAVNVRPTGGLDDIVESGLSAGERVVTRGALLLKGELLRAELSGE